MPSNAILQMLISNVMFEPLQFYPLKRSQGMIKKKKTRIM